MLSLKEYHQSKRVEIGKQLTTQLSTKPLQVQVNSSKKLFDSESEEKEFVRKAKELANSDKVISKLSNELGSPKKGETEDEFVNRGKDILRDILTNALKRS